MKYMITDSALFCTPVKSFLRKSTATDSDINGGHRVYSIELKEIKAVEGILEALIKRFPASTTLTIDNVHQMMELVNTDNHYVPCFKPH